MNAANNTPTHRVAFKRINITPELTEELNLQGYYTKQPRVASEIIAPLEMQLLLLEDEHYNKALFVAADIFGFDAQVVARIRDALEGWGIPPERLVLNASHTHYAPGTVSSVVPSVGTIEPEYVRRIAGDIVHRIHELYANLQPCKISSGLAHAKIGYNRRRTMEDGSVVGLPDPDGYYHAATPFLLIERVRSGGNLLVFNHGCHPTGLDEAPVISSGYPGYARAILRKSKAIKDAMFLQGAAGSSKQGTQQGDQVRWTMTSQDIVENGLKLARGIVDALDESLTPVTGPIHATRRELTLPLASLPSRSTLREIRNNPENGLWIREWAELCLQQFGSGRVDTTSLRQVASEVQLIGLGDTTCFLTFPGEPVAELARDLLGGNPLPPAAFFLGYTNGLHSYIPTARMIEEGGYEASASQKVYRLPADFTPAIEPILSDAVGKLTRAWHVQAGENPPPAPTSDDKSFFCLSTGRCGTKTLANILGLATNAEVYHHPRPYLVEETLHAYHDALDKAETFWRARSSVIRRAWAKDKIFGALDHNMTPFTPAIAEEIPGSKFLILIRNPWDFVRSAMRRQYYRGHVWDHGRLRPEADHPDAGRWEDMSPFEKTCWLWNATYERIRAYLSEIPDDRYRTVYFKELVDDPEYSREIFAFLRLDGFDPDAVAEVLSRKLNRQRAGQFPVPGDWTREQHEILWNECQSSIETYGFETTYENLYHEPPATTH